jgi:putative addiction module component (TIGR02574 family)
MLRIDSFVTLEMSGLWQTWKGRWSVDVAVVAVRTLLPSRLEFQWRTLEILAMSNFAEILTAALALPPQERGELAEVLWESMEESPEGSSETPEISAAWREEIARRSAAYARGELQGIPWRQVREEVRRKYEHHAWS